jgi:hypothetical protein
MAKLKTLGAVTFLSFALASAVSAQQVTKSSGDRTKGTVGTNTAASKNGTSDSRSGRSDGVAGRQVYRVNATPFSLAKTVNVTSANNGLSAVRSLHCRYTDAAVSLAKPLGLPPG